jgi:hypothetical protein
VVAWPYNSWNIVVSTSSGVLWACGTAYTTFSQ